MTNPYRAMCAELVDDLELCDWPYKLKDTIRADIERARALLAEPRHVAQTPKFASTLPRKDLSLFPLGQFDRQEHQFRARYCA